MADIDKQITSHENSIEKLKAKKVQREWAREHLTTLTPEQIDALYDEIHEQRHGEDE